MPDSSVSTPPDRQRYADLLAEARHLRGVSPGRQAWRQLRKNRLAMAALVYVVLLGLLAVLTPLLPLQSPRRVNTAQILAAPESLAVLSKGIDLLDASGNVLPNRVGAEFGELRGMNRWLLDLRLSIFGERAISSVCGTDELGRDLLARLFWGARISLIAGLIAACVSLLIGVSYGATAGFLGGKVDAVMMRLVDVLYSVPFIFVVIFINMFLNEKEVREYLATWGIDRMVVFFMVIGAVYWLTMARVVRGQVISLKHEQFVDAARTIGASSRRIIFVHLVPNLLSIVIVYLTLTIPQIMLFEAFLSFLGFGVQAPDVSWGVLANQGFKVITPIRTFWWLILYPGLALSVTLLALNFLGDGLRDALDPRLKHK